MKRENEEQSQVSKFCYFPKRFPTHTYDVTGKVFKNCSEEPRIVRVRAHVPVVLCMFTVGTQQQKTQIILLLMRITSFHVYVLG
jgi:hypothetical protein